MPVRAGKSAGLIAGALLCAAAASPARAATGYTRCPAPPGFEFVMVARAACTDAAAPVFALAQPGADPAAALAPTGWSPVRASQTSAGSYDLVAMHGRSVLRVRRAGTAPDLDGWEAGRELLFARPTIVGGKPIPSGAALCTSSFLVRWRGAEKGLTAAHCGGLLHDGSVDRRNAALRRAPQPGIVLGRVSAVLTRHAPYDALLLPVPAGATRPDSPTVDRGIARPPWVVGGFARPFSGRRVCFTGRTSGPDHCGRILGHAGVSTQLGVILQLGVVVVCTDIPAKEGDSGGPVYTPGRADGTVNAVGLVTLIAGASRRMCFTPLAPVLDRLGATLLTG